MIVIPASLLAELDHSLSVAANALTPLANGAKISQEAQISLAAIGQIALNQARTAVKQLQANEVTVLPN